MTTAIEATRSRGARRADLVVTVTSLVTLVLVAVVAAFVAFVAVFSTDSCGYGGRDPAMCQNGAVVWVIIGYWAALGIVALAAMVLSLVALARDRRAWPYAAGGILLTVLVGSVASWLLLTQ